MDSEVARGKFPHGWHRTFYTLWLGAFITGMGYSMTMPFISLFIAELGNFTRFHLNFTFCLSFIFFYCLDRNPCRLIVWKMKLTRRDTAKSNAFDCILFCERKTGTITGGEIRLVLFRQTAMNNWSHRMQDKLTGKIKGRGYLRLSGFLFAPLSVPNLCTGCPQPDSRKGVDRIVNTAVIRAEAAQQPAVCSIDDRITLQRGNIPLPKIKRILNRC